MNSGQNIPALARRSQLSAPTTSKRDVGRTRNHSIARGATASSSWMAAEGTCVSPTHWAGSEGELSDGTDLMPLLR